MIAWLIVAAGSLGVVSVLLAVAVLGNRDLVRENRRLRAQVIRTSGHPSTRGRDRMVGEPLFADTLTAIRALPEAPRPTAVLRLDEDAETVEWRGNQ